MSTAVSSTLSNCRIIELLRLFAAPRGQRTTRDALVHLLPALLVFALTAMRSDLLVHDGNIYSQIASGMWMLNRHAIIYADPFSYTFLGHPSLSHEWLAEVVMAGAFQLGSWQAVDLLFGVSAAATAFLLMRMLLKYLAPVPALVMQVLALLCMVPNLGLGPRALAAPLLIAWTGELLSARDEKRSPHWPTLLLMVIWANVHGSFVVGLLLVFLFGLEASIEAGKFWPHVLWPWFGFGLGTLMAALVTPNGIAGLVFPFQVMSSGLASVINEFQSSVFPTVTPLEIFLLATMFFFMVTRARVPLLRLLLFLLLVHMTLEHRHEIVVLAAVAPMILAPAIGEALNEDANFPMPIQATARSPFFMTAGTVLIAALIAAVRFAVPAAPATSSFTPVSALAHVPAEIARRPVFNDYIMGGYLISRGIRPFIYGRADMFGYDFTRNYVQMIKPDRHAIESTFSKYHVGWTILAPDNPANDILDLLPGWHVLYKDKFSIVHVREDWRATSPAGIHAAIH